GRHPQSVRQLERLIKPRGVEQGKERASRVADRKIGGEDVLDETEPLDLQAAYFGTGDLALREPRLVQCNDAIDLVQRSLCDGAVGLRQDGREVCPPHVQCQLTCLVVDRETGGLMSSFSGCRPKAAAAGKLEFLIDADGKLLPAPIARLRRLEHRIAGRVDR